MIERFGTNYRIQCDYCKTATSKWYTGESRAISGAKKEGFVFWRVLHVCAKCDKELTAEMDELDAENS